jgi:hypothetical protein
VPVHDVFLLSAVSIQQSDNEAAVTQRPSFALRDAVALLSRTPATLDTLLRGLPAWWTMANEGADTWSPFDVIGHLVHGEETDWIPRVKTILEHGESRTFEKFNREAQFESASGATLESRLDEFATLRRENLRELASFELTEADLERTGRHPAFGVVTLRQLLATWVAHDLDHVMQVSRVLGQQYADDVGPWRAYLRIISGQPG